jgi:hypothetical protein
MGDVVSTRPRGASPRSHDSGPTTADSVLPTGRVYLLRSRTRTASG